MNQGFSIEDVGIAQKGALGIITLNRPKALNALTIDMIRVISATLRRWETDNEIKAVLFLGAGERAFCSGGDIKGFHRAGMDYRQGVISRKAGCVFFAEEYSLDLQIFHYSKPTIAFMDGIVMGGGFGIGGNCKHRIATDKTIFAMPETGIGFFPDVGAVYHLLKSPKNFGFYLGLTASHVNAADMMAAKLADYFVSSVLRDELIKALENAGDPQDSIRQFETAPPQDGIFKTHGDVVEKIFNEKNVFRVVQGLKDDGSPFAMKTLETIESRSPTSLIVTAEHFRRSEGKDFGGVIATDFTLSQRFLDRSDFYEGIRAAVIDKDKNPRWEPASIEDVPRDTVETHFLPTGHNLFDVRLYVA